MNDFEIASEPRPIAGTSATRRLRRAGKIPAVVYGGGLEPEMIALDASRIRHHTENEAFFSHLLNLNMEGKNTSVVVKAVQRDPRNDHITHVDFLRVVAADELHMNVPLHFSGEDLCVGAKTGGVITHLLLEVEVGCLPKHLPEYIEVDVSALGIGEAVHLSDLKLPANVRLMALEQNPDNDQPVVRIQYAQKLHDEEDAEDTVESVAE